MHELKQCKTCIVSNANRMKTAITVITTYSMISNYLSVNIDKFQISHIQHQFILNYCTKKED